MGLGTLAQRLVAWAQDKSVKLDDQFLLDRIEPPERDHALAAMKAIALGPAHFARLRPALEAAVAAAPPEDPLIFERNGQIILRTVNPATGRFLVDQGAVRFPEVPAGGICLQYNTYGAATFALGMGWVGAGEYERAVDVLRAGLRRQPDFATLVSELGVALQALGRTDEALALFNDWLGRREEMDEGSQREVLISCGQLLLMLERPDEAEAMFLDCVALFPGDGLAAWELEQIAAFRRGEPLPHRVLATYP